MRQVAQRPRDGRVSVVEAPPPALRPGWVLVANRYSLISAGTERTKMLTGEKSLVGKARARPDLVRKVVDKARADGVAAALGSALDRLAALEPIGYSSAGVVLRVGSGVHGLASGDQVACGGGGWANHAEIVSVPQRLVAPVPAGVALADAAYATVGAVALHGVRQSGAAIGEHVGVVGLGLVGQLAVRILAAAGCRVVGIDLDDAAVERAQQGGAFAFTRDHPELYAAVRQATGGAGLDAVLLCASSPSRDPLALAVELTRDRGRIVVVGETRIDVDRARMYEKELELRMSRSYGPGRYDREYEERGRDLPPGYVRWTEQRNMEAFLVLVASGRVAPAELTTHRFAVADAGAAYGALTGVEECTRPFGILLEYPAPHVEPERRARLSGNGRARTQGVGLIGAGAFARSTILPALRSAGAPLVAVASETGLTAADVASRFGFERAAESAAEILDDETVGAVVIATRNANHAALAAAALRAGKATFVEKPLALDRIDLAEIEAALSPDSVFMVGFNRRLAPHVIRLQEELGGVEDLVISIRVNAGHLPDDHWLHDPLEGGGRLLGEGCHFVDLLAILAGGHAVAAHAYAVPQRGRSLECSDSFGAQIRFAGAVGSIVYSGSGDTSLPKERLEVHGGGVSAVLDDFAKLAVHRDGRKRTWRSPRDKGHRATIARFLEAARGEAAAPPAGTYLASTELTFALVDSLRTGQPVEVAP